MSSERFHKAAKDGKIEILKEATKRDCNSRDKQKMTPTLYAAFNGHLEALRVLCGRGGDPDKADIFGKTALHLAASQGHNPVVTFLVNFGANIYATDIDGRTPQDVAAMNNRDDILRFLDGVHAKLEATDKKKMKALQERAKEDAKKQLKRYNNHKKKAEEKREKQERRLSKDYRPSMMQTIRMKMSGSTSNLATQVTVTPRHTFSKLLSGGTISGNKQIGTVQKMILANKNNRLAGLNNDDDDFKISEIEDGKRSVRSLKGIRRDSEVLYGGTIENRRGRLDGVFNEAEHVNSAPPPSNGMIRSMSQPDFVQELANSDTKEPQSIFIRPGMGSIVIRKSITNTFGGLYSGINSIDESSLDSGESYPARNVTDDELSESDSDSEDDNPNGPLERFLVAFGLGEHLQKFIEQEITLDSLMLFTENDLRRLNLPLGPHVTLVNAVKERKLALESPGEVMDSQL
ncbi:Usher syndrome type-1G protein homolog [Aethina tumida]|uniref:Usher syndrome type-1G protein homolog n=1 Tax=Aethina tumida TaxID=116153 RepID=UPI00096B59DE|nr:Usher syndrome type-1G protein homolog [Aethina tumida]